MMPAMMHAHMIVIAVVIACLLRVLSLSIIRVSANKPSSNIDGQQNFQRHWAKTLSAFLVPPVFLMMTALAIVIMGPSSCHALEGWLSYYLSIFFLFTAGLLWTRIGWNGFISQRAVRRAPSQVIRTSLGPVRGHILDLPIAFSAQVGCWNPSLAVSSELIAHLDEAHLSAVIAHEKGHVHYKDTFWFLWLGGFRRLTFWLPGTEHLWQELLLLRELRADRWAIQHVDKLVLAESLMRVVSMPTSSLSASNLFAPNILTSKSPKFETTTAASFSCPASTDRLSRRVEAILAEDTTCKSENQRLRGNHWISSWISIGGSLTPLLTIPFHH